MEPQTCKEHWDKVTRKASIVCGSEAHQKDDNRRWMTIFEKINWVLNKSTETHMADLCTGWGRIIYDNALNLDHKFTTYTGIDNSENLISNFMKNPKKKCKHSL